MNSVRPHSFIWITLVTLHCASPICFAGEGPKVEVTTNLLARPANWAVKLKLPGLPNCHQVTSNLFRGAQPTAEGMKELKQMGVKTVFNLRGFHSDDDEARGTGLKQGHVRMHLWHTEEEDVVQFLKTVSNTNNLPLYLHCQRGADRTGMMCAMYRIVICNWSKQEAISEMTEGGFGFYSGWQNIVRYIERADIEELKRKAGIKTR